MPLLAASGHVIGVKICWALLPQLLGHNGSSKFSGYCSLIVVQAISI